MLINCLYQHHIFALIRTHFYSKQTHQSFYSKQCVTLSVGWYLVTVSQSSMSYNSLTPTFCKRFSDCCDSHRTFQHMMSTTQIPQKSHVPRSTWSSVWKENREKIHLYYRKRSWNHMLYPNGLKTCYKRFIFQINTSYEVVFNTDDNKKCVVRSKSSY